MRRPSWLALLPLLALPLHAQQPHRPFGLGFVLNRSTFLVPIGLSGTVTLEPELSVYRYSRETPLSADSFNRFDARSWNVSAGLGLLFELHERGSVRPYIGPRAGFTIYDYRSATGGGTAYTAKSTDWWVGGAVGAQYFFSPHFSLGGEASLTYTYVGDTRYDPPSLGSGNNYITRRILTSGDIIVRWFF